MTHQIDVLSFESRWDFAFLGRQLANKWLCTTQNWLFCVVLVIWLRHVQFFRKNRRPFAWKCFVREQLLFDLAHLKTPIQSTAVYFRIIRVNPRSITCHDAIDVFRSTATVFLEHFFRPIDMSLFLSDWQIVCVHAILNVLCGIQRKQIFLTVKCSCNIECMLVPTNAWGCLNLTIGHMTNLQYQLTHSINGFRNNN